MFGLLFICERAGRHGCLLPLLCEVTRAVSTAVASLLKISRHDVVITATEGSLCTQVAIAEKSGSLEKHPKLRQIFLCRTRLCAALLPKGELRNVTIDIRLPSVHVAHRHIVMHRRCP